MLFTQFRRVMAGIKLLGNHAEVIKEIGNNKFFIFGNTLFSEVFYLNCKKNNIENQIAAFVLSDLSRDKRKVHMMHGNIPVWDIEELKKHKEMTTGFIGASEKIIREVIPGLFDLNMYSMFCVSSFVNNIEYYHNMCQSSGVVSDTYLMENNYYDKGYINLYDRKNISTEYFKYAFRVCMGVNPDENIFAGQNLKKMIDKQYGDYRVMLPGSVNSITKSKNNYTIYCAKSHFDHELKDEYYTPNTRSIQVGSALTEADISDIKDNTGENISHRNRDYCEMTAVYWIWKNDYNSKYVGLCHYRRKFVIDENMMNYIISEGYDAVYTVPKLTDGGMREEFVERNYYITPEMWDLTENAIRDISPDYYDSWTEFSSSYFLISCNMFIMKREIFDEYCSWIFKILSKVDSHYMSQGIQRNDRYLGYIAECLTSVFAMKKKQTLKKVFVELKTLDCK